MSFTNSYCSRDSARALRHGLLGALMAIGVAAPQMVWAERDHHGRDHGMFMMGNPDKVARKVDHMLEHLDATDAQRTQVKQIVQAAAADLKAQRAAGKVLREQAMVLFKQAVVDEGAVETLRQQMVQQMDQSSRRITQAMLEVSRTLTTEQRAKLAEQMKRRHEKRQRHWHD